MKRILSVFLTILPLLNLFSCGKSDPPIESTEPQNILSETGIGALLTDGLPDTDMKGFIFNVLHHDDSWLTWAKIQLSADEENGELINDAIYRRNIYIEERFNCKLNLATTDQTSKVFKSLVQAGGNEYDVIFQYGLNVLGNIDYLADFDNIPHLNLDAEWWNPNATEVFRVGDKQLAIAGNLTLSYLSGATTFVFNKEIYADLGIKENIYTVVDDGKWTTDKYYEIAKQAALDLNGDTMIDTNDRTGMAGASKGYYNTLIIGAGFKYVDFDNDHNPYFNMYGNEKMIGFFQKIVNTESAAPYIYLVTNDMLTSSYLANAGPAIDFISGQSLFLHHMIFGIETGLRDMKADFGILPAPKYDEAQEQYNTYANIGEIATLPRSYDSSRADNVGTILEAMAFYSQQNIVPAYKETVLQVKLTRDEDSARMLDYIFRNIVFDYGTVVWETKITGELIKNYLLPRSSALVSTVEQINGVMKKDIEALIKSAADVP